MDSVQARSLWQKNHYYLIKLPQNNVCNNLLFDKELVNALLSVYFDVYFSVFSSLDWLQTINTWAFLGEVTYWLLSCFNPNGKKKKRLFTIFSQMQTIISERRHHSVHHYW